jgi:hypothetical protein
MAAPLTIQSTLLTPTSITYMVVRVQAGCSLAGMTQVKLAGVSITGI